MDEGKENTADHQAAIRDFKEKSTKVLEDLSRSFWLQLAECKHSLGKILSKEISQAALLQAECGLLVVKQRAEIEALENARVGAQELIGQLQQKLKELEVLEMARKKAAASAKEPAPRPRRTEARLTRFKALWMTYWIKTSGGLKAARNTFLEGMSTVGVVMWRLRRIAVVTLIVLLVGHFVVAPIISGTCKMAAISALTGRKARARVCDKYSTSCGTGRKIHSQSAITVCSHSDQHTDHRENREGR